MDFISDMFFQLVTVFIGGNIKIHKFVFAFAFNKFVKCMN